jgi:hypothetical protein
VFRFVRDTDLKGFSLDLQQSPLHISWNFAVVVLPKLLVAGWDITDQSTAQELQIFTKFVGRLGNGEELLLESDEHNR